MWPSGMPEPIGTSCAGRRPLARAVPSARSMRHAATAFVSGAGPKCATNASAWNTSSACQTTLGMLASGTVSPQNSLKASGVT